MKAHIGTHQMCFLTGILGVGLLSFGAGPYGSGADTVTRSDPAVARLPGAVPVSSGEIRAEDGGVWEAYTGMVAAATAECYPSSPPEPDTIVYPGDPPLVVENQKIRYLSFTAGDPGRLQAVRVTFVNLPAPYDTWNGVVMWVQQPTTYCENSGVKLPPCPPAQPASDFLGATLGCTPYFTDWSARGVVHVFNEGIVPGATYVVQVVDSTCDPGQESHYSDPLLMTQSIWGDLVKDCATCPCTPPDGATGIPTDVTAVLDKFRNMEPPEFACAPVSKTRADHDWVIVNQLINISDVTCCMDAFRGVPYPPPSFTPPGEPPCDGPTFVCGNEILEPGEQCDDGNRIPGDGCDENCMSELCGNGAIDGGEECDDGPGNSDTEPDACRTDCTLPRCGDDVVDSGEQCDDGNTTPGDGCDENCQIEPFVGDAVISLVPVSSSDTGATIVEEDNKIELSSGGHQVFLNIRVSDWDPGATGLQLKAWQAVIDSTGYISGLQGTLTPYAPACVTDSDCETLMGPLGDPWCGAKGGCGAAGWPAGECIPAWIDSARTDYIMASTSDSAALDVSTLDFRYGSTASAFSSPGIAELYAGTLAVDVPVDAAGTFVIDFRRGAGDTCLIDQDNYLIPLGGIEPAVVTVLTACCLPDGSCNPAMTAEDCQSAGGAIVTECAGDNNGNGIDDACESAGCCFGDGSCMELSRADCGAQGGTFVCACLGDDDPINGVDDACESCAVASTALAEPMPCLDNDDCDEGTGSCNVYGICECSDNDDCWNLASCINGVCYVPKNRYITFEPNNAGRCVAFRVDMTSSDTFPTCTFTKRWVGAPNPVTGISRVVAEPVYRDWTEEVIYVADIEIVPASTYEVSAIQQACDPEPEPGSYSPPLILRTVPIPETCADSCVAPCPWADIVGIQVYPGIYLPPDGKVDFDDIVAMIEAILEDVNAPPISWTDLMREVPNGRIDIRDLLAVDDVCRSTDPYFTDYPGASPCGTPSVDQPSEGAEGPRTTYPVLECRLFDSDENLLIRDLTGRYQAIPSQTVEAEMFLKDVVKLRAYKIAFEPARNGKNVAAWISCPDDIYIEHPHSVCAGTRENCVYEDDCMWWCVGGSNDGGPCDQDAECEGGACITGSCVEGGNPGAQCDPDVDCTDGVCEDALKACVGGIDHGAPCLDSSDCDGGQPCNACADDFIFFSSLPTALAHPICKTDVFEIEGTGDAADVGDRPPGYLGTYKLDIPGDVGGGTFNIEIMPLDNRNQETEETTFFLTSLLNANEDSISFEYDVPCARLKVLYDCNLNGMPDVCDIGDEDTCASELCQAYTDSGRAECGQSNNCNANAIPDECEIAEFFCADCCVGCPKEEGTTHCMCCETGEPCPEGCDCVTGEGCPEDCGPKCVLTAACLPDCNKNYVPDECEIPEDPVHHPGEFFCPVDCICSTTQEPCPEDCDCHTGDGCPVGCEPVCVPTAGCAQDCQPEGVRGHGIPDECDITEYDGGLCEGEGGENEEDCSWDCQHDHPDEPGHRVPDECEANNCNRWDGEDGDWCPDDCEDQNRPDQGCGQGVAEQDCDGDGTCNVDEISEDNNGACTSENCSSDCHVYCYDPEVYKPWCDPYVGIPDECDIRDCSGGDPDCSDCDGNGVPDWCDINIGCESSCCADCNKNNIPDGCDLRDCSGDVACEDCNFNSVPDACDIPDDWGGLCEVDPAECESCDANANGMPDECECPGASESGACENAFDDGPAETTFTIQAALAIQLLDEDDEDFVGLASPFTGLSGSATIWRGTLHFHDDDPEDKGDDQPCLVPPGFPEPHPTDFARSREVHLEITDLDLTGPDVSLGLRGAALGEAQGTCLDFPADIFFAWYVQATIGQVRLHSETPIILRGELPDFGWTFSNPRSVFVNDHSAPAIPLFDANGVHRAYLTRIQLGQGTFPSDSEGCAVDRAISGPVSFAVDRDTTGVNISTPNEVYADREKAAKKVRAYVSSGATSPAPPDTTNVMDTILAGNTVLEDDFNSADRIKSLSFGKDGTRDPTAEGLAPVLYFSVDGISLGGDCTDVRSEWDRQGTAAADVFASPMPTFGNYAEFPGTLPSSCDTTRGNCLVADNTALGLGPHAGEGALDNVVGLEFDDFVDGDLAYLTFLGPSFDGDSATIWVYDNHSDHVTYPFKPGNLQSYADADDLGLQANDVIDALVVSDVTPGTKVCVGDDQYSCTNDGDCIGHGTPEICTDVPDGVWNTGDEVLFSLASGSQTLVGHGWSGAHIFKVTHGQSDPITAANVFLGPAALGLVSSTDDIDAIDVGVSKVFEDCNHNGIDDLCDIARGFSVDELGESGVPDECETACPVTSEAPEPERLPLIGDPISQKVRYISFTASGTGQRQAIRVTFEDLPAPFHVFNGEVMWVGEPKTYCEAGGTKTPPCPVEVPDEFLGATLQCQPYFTDWHGICRCEWCIGGFNDGQTCSEDSDCAHTIHVYHQLIVPSGVYRIDVIDQRCLDLGNELSYSEPMDKDDLETTTSKWGDLVRSCAACPCTPPDKVVNMASDVTAVIDKFGNLDGAPTKARADLDWETPNQRIDISDVTHVLDAFQGFAYPFPAPDLPLCDDGASDW